MAALFRTSSFPYKMLSLLVCKALLVPSLDRLDSFPPPLLFYLGAIVLWLVEASPHPALLSLGLDHTAHQFGA